MTSRERTLLALHGARADRVPLNVFAGWNPGFLSKATEKHGTLSAFIDWLHLDIVTGIVPRLPFGDLRDSKSLPGPDEYLSMDMMDPNSPEILNKSWPDATFLSVEKALAYHTGGKDEKAVAAHVWGVFELYQFMFERRRTPGTEDALVNMMVDPGKTTELFLKLAKWTAGCIDNASRAGVDFVELSDDWGQQNTMLFSPELWWELIFPATNVIVGAARQHDLPILLHSDGDITQVLDGVAKLGVDGLHPMQESAGMSITETRRILGKDTCIMGGLDVVTALPAMDKQQIRDEVRRVFTDYKESGPFIFSSSHMIQDDTSLEVLEAAYAEAYAQSA